MTIERKRLSPRQTITLGNDKYTISGKRGDGTSSIVYDATTHIEALNKTKKVLIKELFPVNLNIRRDSVGALIIPKASVDLFKKYKESFKNAAKLQLEFHNPFEDADTASSTNSTSNLENLYESGNTLYSVMSLDDGQTYEEYNSGDLRSHIEICRNLADAIRKYHKRGYLHLDIKPKNIFVLAGSNQIKLFDFDTVQRKEDITHQNCQLSYTQAYAPPELLLAETDSDYYEKIDERTDIYMIGATLLYKLFDRTPIFSDRIPFQTWDFDKSDLVKTASPQVKNALTILLKKTLAHLQHNRYSDIAELIAALDQIIDLLKFNYYLVNQHIYKTTPESNYIRRNNTLSELHKLLCNKQMAFLYGMGGIGKSETARAYAEEYRSEYSVIQLLGYRSNLEETIGSLEFSDDLQYYNNKDNYNKSRFDYVYNRLQGKLLNNNKTLIIVDNYNYSNDKNSKEYKRNEEVTKKLEKLFIRFVFTTKNIPTLSYKDNMIKIREFGISELQKLFFSINPEGKDDLNRIKKIDNIIELTGRHTMMIDRVARLSRSVEGYGEKSIDDLIGVIKKKGFNNEIDIPVESNKDDNYLEDTPYEQMQSVFNVNNLNDIEKFILLAASLLPVTGMKERDFCELIAIDKISGTPSGWGLNKYITNLVNMAFLRRSGHKDVIVSVHPIVADISLNELKTLFNSDSFRYMYENIAAKKKDTHPLYLSFYETHFCPSSTGFSRFFDYNILISNIIIKVPLTDYNFVLVSKLASRARRYADYGTTFKNASNALDVYLSKADLYIHEKGVISDEERAWYNKLCCIWNCQWHIPLIPFKQFPKIPNLQKKLRSIHYSYKKNKVAKKFAYYSFEYFKTKLNNKELANLATEFAQVFWMTFDRDTSIYFGEEALKYSQTLDDQQLIINAMSDLSLYYFWRAHFYDSEEARIYNINKSEQLSDSAIALYSKTPEFIDLKNRLASKFQLHMILQSLKKEIAAFCESKNNQMPMLEDFSLDSFDKTQLQKLTRELRKYQNMIKKLWFLCFEYKRQVLFL